MGASGWYAGIFLVNGMKIRGTVSFDIFHRLHCDIQDAAVAAGLELARLEAAAVCAVRRGPYPKPKCNQYRIIIMVVHGAAHPYFKMPRAHSAKVWD